MNVVKWHGLGNDYLFVEASAVSPDDAPDIARLLSDRRRGPGADGLVLLGPTDRSDADLRMTILNADGSDGGVCGNGLRCAAAWVVSEGRHSIAAGDESENAIVRIETPAGISVATVETASESPFEWTVSVAMPPPRFELVSIPAVVPGRDGGETVVGMPMPALARIAGLPSTSRWSLVSTGNPHLVAWCEDDEDIDRVRLEAIGPGLEVHAWFPARINIHLVTTASDQLRMRTWERGSGETTACGTGACAVVASLVHGGRLAAEETHRVVLPGGELGIAWAGDAESPIRMTGEAVRVASVEVDDRWIECGLRRERHEGG